MVVRSKEASFAFVQAGSVTGLGVLNAKFYGDDVISGVLDRLTGLHCAAILILAITFAEFPRYRGLKEDRKNNRRDESHFEDGRINASPPVGPHESVRRNLRTHRPIGRDR